MGSALPRTAFTALLAAVAIGAACARDRAEPSRGAALYEAHCGECHTSQAHWRQKHIVKSWPELLFQVERWQHVAGRNWSAEEIEDVAAYLNGQFYHLPCTLAGCKPGKAA